MAVQPNQQFSMGMKESLTNILHHTLLLCCISQYNYSILDPPTQQSFVRFFKSLPEVSKYVIIMQIL